MINITNIGIRQILLASALVMAASGEASAQTTLAVIAQYSIPYSASPQDVFGEPPVGQFEVNMHLCVAKEMTILDPMQYLRFILPSGESVYSEFRFQRAITRDPAGDKKCESIAAQASTQAKSTVAGNEAAAGSLEDGIAAEDRGDWKAAFVLLEPLAKQGNPDAKNRIGYMYNFGKGMRQDYAVAMKWYRIAAAQRRAKAQTNIGFMYENGQGVPQDYAEAMKWYRKAADQGIAGAQSNIGAMYANGEGVPQDYAEATKWYRKAADQRNAVAQNNLGTLYANGQGVPKDSAEAMKWWRKAADQGNADAQNNLKIMSTRGLSDQVADPFKNLTIMEHALALERVGDWKSAFLLLMPLAEQGDASAQYALGFMYANGQGVPQDSAESMKWYRKASDQGNADAQNNLRGMSTVDGPLENGYAAERRGDFQAAFLLLEPLTKQGNAKAQFEVGHMYHTGKGGVPQDYIKALEWFRKSADQGNADAEVNLGSMYYFGQVVPQDYAEAMK